MNDKFLCINTETGRATRYATTRLIGMRIREAGAVDIQDYNAFKPIPLETQMALESFRKEGTLG